METKDKPKDGSIQLKAGKATIQWQGKAVPFGVFFVANQVRQTLRRSRQGFYTDKVRAIMRDLERGGLFAIPECKKRLEGLAPGAKDLNQQYVKMVCGWLGQLWSFRQVKTGGVQKPDYGKEYERIFQKAA